MGEKNQLFREKTMERISSPEQLTDYLRVTNPGIWAVLIAVILILVGIIAWAAVGVLETTADATAVISDGKARIVGSVDSEQLKTGMTVHVASEEYIISEIEVDEYGRSVAYADVSIPDGTYEAEIVIEQIHPISFLLESR